MTKRDKLLERIRNNPKAVPFDDLRLLMEYWEFELASVSGSHYTFRWVIAGKTHKLTIPYKRPHVKPSYVVKALKLIGQIAEEGK